MLLTPAQGTVARDTHRFRVLDAGRRFGKTILAGEEILGVALNTDDAVIPYIAPTYKQARDIAWRHFVKRFAPITIGKPNETRLEITIKNAKGGQSLVMLRGWESIESLRGQKFPFFVADEVAMYREFWVGWEEVLRPALTDYRGGALFISSPKGFNHFYDLHNHERDAKINANDEWQSFKYTTYDNPFIPKDEIEAARVSMTEDRFAQEYLAEFRKMEGLVYKEFDRSRHIFDDTTGRRPIAEVIAGLDFGYTNPAALLTIEHDTDNHYWVTHEWYKTQKTNAEIIEVAKTTHANVFYADPAEPDRIEEMRRAGLNVRDVSKDIVKGVDSVRELFKQNRLHIHQRCQNLITELESYQYPEKATNHNEPEVPLKENDHAVDALRYALFNNAPTATEDYEANFSMYRTTYN